MKNFSCILFSCISIFITSCDQEQSDSKSFAESELQVYVHTFESEAAFRGFSINVANLGVEVEFADIEESNVLGVCYFHSHAPGRIEIDLESWKELSSTWKEYVVFHELGHCVLDRGHSETYYDNGTCQSIMASGTGSCRENYTAQTREAYIDELFSSANSMP